MGLERPDKVELYTSVLNDILRTSANRWVGDEADSKDLEADSVILNTVLGIAAQSGHGFDVLLKDDLVIGGEIPGITLAVEKHVTQGANGNIYISTPTSDESWEKHGKRFYVVVNKDYLLLRTKSRFEGTFRRKDVISIVARD